MPTDSVDDGEPVRADGKVFGGVEYLLFDSLVHHLIEKGVLTKNDALSVVQTAAQVVHGRLHESENAATLAAELSMLERSYGSFAALPDRYGRPGMDAQNVRPLRVPLHGEQPHFPTDDDD